jgi:hypothetical protein
MASPFQKYQSEQVQQIPAGYVEAMGSMGRAYASIGQSIAGGIQEADKKATEEAKMQGALAPYIKNDKRVQTVEEMIRGGTLVKKDDGTVEVNPIYKDVWDGAKAKPIMDFYNQTGGDGSKLTGKDLTKFATEFESQQKYDAAQSAKADKEVERQKTLAEIEKLKADAAEKMAGTAANAVVAGYASGTPFAPQPTAPLGYTPQAQPGQPTPGQVLPANSTGGINLSDIKTSPGFDVNRYNAGMKLSGDLNAAPVAPPAPAPNLAPPAQSRGLPSPSINISEVVATTEALRVEYFTQYEKESNSLKSEQAAAMIALGRTGGATPERIKSLNETFKVRKDNLDKSYAERTALIDSRVKAAATITDEARKVQDDKNKAAAELRAEAATKIAKERAEADKKEDQRKVEAFEMTKEEFNIKWGVPVKAGAAGAPATTATPGKKPTAAETPGTFANFQFVTVEGAGSVTGRTGGTESEKAKEERYGVFQKRKQDYPARWGIGVYHTGAKEFQLDLNYRPTATPIDPGSRSKINDTLEGYSEAQTFLQELDNVVNSTDDNAITNYLNRSLWTASESAKKTVITGDMMNQFGVAAFRRAIVSGGNFSDADREYVAKLITDINSAHIKKDKSLLKAQTAALAGFIDQKYRSTLAANDMTFDIETSKKFLTREGDTAGLEQLKKAEQYTKAFNVDTKNNTKPEYDNTGLPSKLDEIAAGFEASGTAEGIKQAKVYRKAAADKRKEYETAAEQAKANVERTKTR